MTNKELYDKVALRCSKMTTRAYSTSFSLGILLFDKSIQPHIYSIYGFVRYADEIVDTFHEYDKKDLLKRFKEDTYKAIDEGISLNPILNSFQNTVREFGIDRNIIELFLNSMEMDLDDIVYDQSQYEKYILGSAEVVGLMCLKVFCKGDEDFYNKLEFPAMRLGSAFQKINFLRDLNADFSDLGRTYFPGVNMSSFNDEVKREIEEDIEKDFKAGYEGIKQLPKSSRFGVYLAYVYYYSLFKKIQQTDSSHIMNKRIRIPNQKKYRLLVSSYVRYNLNLI